MYINKCTKCGAEFETKNPKRVICPNCLYPEKAQGEENYSERPPQDRPNSYSSGGYSPDSHQQPRYRQPDNRGYNQGGGYNRPQGGGYDRPQQGGYNRPQGGGYNRPQQGGYDRPRTPRPYDRRNEGGYNQGGGYNRPQGGGYDRPQQGGYNRPQGGGYNNRPQQGGYNRPQGGGFNRRPQGGGGRPNQNRPPKQLLVNREQLAQIEELYKKMLPLPNPDAHEVIGEQIGLEARKVFFGINLIRQKMMLPKLAFPKRKLAISPDQLIAITTLYQPLLPLPPIGCHKIIAAQLKIDEWRVHVGIGLVRKQLGLDRWNPDREDAPEEFKVKKEEEPEKPKTRGRKKKTDEAKDE